jgi:hypothetical protein
MTVHTWDQIIASLLKSGPKSIARVAARHMQHPRDAGIALTFGAPYGQRASYRALLTDGRTLCIEDFGAVYEAHLENPSPAPPPAPRATAAETVAGLTALGALLGLAFGGNKDGALTGALLGGVSGLATMAITEADRSPATSKTALELAKAVSALLLSAVGPSADPRQFRSTTHARRITRKRGSS